MNKFIRGLLIYALVFLLIAGAGLVWFWQFIEDFESSRPDTALNSYVKSLSGEYVADRSLDLIASIDHRVQTEDQCRQALIAALSDTFTCAKKSTESTQTRFVYAVRCGKQVIGTMIMEQCGEKTGSFQSWQVTKEKFDLSYLLSEPARITVPEEYPVYFDGNLLTKDYISKDKIPYDLLKGLYEEYTLPYMVTYTVGPVLGAGELSVTDPEGNAATIDETTDMTVFLNNCDAKQAENVDAHAKKFIQAYVDFMSCTGGDTAANYRTLSSYIVSNTKLARRLRTAMDGLKWVTDRGAKITDFTVHNRLAMADGRYLWDVSYAVSTTDFAGSIETTSRVKLVIAETDKGLKTEAMKNG